MTRLSPVLKTFVARARIQDVPVFRGSANLKTRKTALVYFAVLRWPLQVTGQPIAIAPAHPVTTRNPLSSRRLFEEDQEAAPIASA